MDLGELLTHWRKDNEYPPYYGSIRTGSHGIKDLLSDLKMFLKKIIKFFKKVLKKI